MKYDLVFEGGGAKGLVFAGAIQALEAAGHEVGRVIGTSAGAITATLLAAGYDSAELMAAVNEKLPTGKPRFSNFMDVPESFEGDVVNKSLSYQVLKEMDIPYIPAVVEEPLDRLIIAGLMQSPPYRHIFSFVEQGGWYAGAKFLEWIQEKLNANGRNLGSTTLSGFHQITGRDLSVVAADTTGQEMLVLNHRTSPGCPVAWAVRMSMSVPFVWQEVRWQAGWGQYRGRDLTDHIIVDGGLLSNFPLHLLLSRDEEIIEIMGDDPGDNEVMGLLIDETLPVPNAPLPPAPPRPATASALSRIELGQLVIVQRLKGMADTLTTAHDKFVIDAYKHLVCRLPAATYGTLEFNMTDERVKALVAVGRAVVEAHLQQ
jgi:predicted acylesterase/phospholipase RssA